MPEPIFDMPWKKEQAVTQSDARALCCWRKSPATTEHPAWAQRAA